jgi:uncharacterized membrane protein
MTGLGDLPGGRFDSVARAVTADGSIIVGESRVSQNIIEAFIWDPTNGMRRVQDVLNAAGADVQGWGLRTVAAITPDGRFIAGWGENPRGIQEAWIADISGLVPEPSEVSMIVSGLPALALLAYAARRPASHTGWRADMPAGERYQRQRA